MPPRMGKSELCSHWFPAWYLGTNPSHPIILTSYEADFARDWGRAARNSLESHGAEVFGVRLAEDSSAAHRWGLQGHRGGMMTAGVGGGITGRGGKLLIIDDPVKNADEAESQTYRQKNWDWYRSTFRTRREPDAIQLLVMTRWHDDDLGGRILKEESDLWDVIELPALAEGTDPADMTWTRDLGWSLWPGRFSQADLEETRSIIGSYFWNALYRQKPSPSEGTIFHRTDWRYYNPATARLFGKRVEQIFNFVDTAWRDENLAMQRRASGAGTPDRSAIQTWAKVGRGFFLIDLWAGRMETPELKRKLKSWHTQHPYGFIIEEAASGYALLQELERETDYALIPYRADRAKIVRARAASPRVEAHQVFLPDGIRHWDRERGAAITRLVDDFVDELSAFPKGEHDDQVDAFSMAMERLGEPVYSFL